MRHHTMMCWLNDGKKESKEELHTIIKTFIYQK